MAIAIVLRPQYFAHLRLVLGEIVECDETTKPRHVIHERASGFAAIELGRAVPGDAFESGGKFRLTERISRLKHFAVVQKDPAADGEALQSGVLFFEFVGEPLADRKAILSKANGWGHNVRELHRAKGLQRESEAGDGSWDSDGLVANDRSFLLQLSILADVHIPGGFARSGFAIVQESSFAIGKTNQHEAAAADVACRGFDYGQCKGHGNGSVHRVAATLEDLHASLGAKLLVGGDHPVRSADRLLRPRFGYLGAIARCRDRLRTCARRQRQSGGQQGEEGHQRCFLHSHHREKTLSDSWDSVKASSCLAIPQYFGRSRGVFMRPPLSMRLSRSLAKF